MLEQDGSGKDFKRRVLCVYPRVGFVALGDADDLYLISWNGETVLYAWESACYLKWTVGACVLENGIVLTRCPHWTYAWARDQANPLSMYFSSDVFKTHVYDRGGDRGAILSSDRLLTNERVSTFKGIQPSAANEIRTPWLRFPGFAHAVIFERTQFRWLVAPIERAPTGTLSDRLLYEFDPVEETTYALETPPAPETIPTGFTAFYTPSPKGSRGGYFEDPPQPPVRSIWPAPPPFSTESRLRFLKVLSHYLLFWDPQEKRYALRRHRAPVSDNDPTCFFPASSHGGDGWIVALRRQTASTSIVWIDALTATHREIFLPRRWENLLPLPSRPGKVRLALVHEFRVLKLGLYHS